MSKGNLGITKCIACGCLLPYHLQDCPKRVESLARETGVKASPGHDREQTNTDIAQGPSTASEPTLGGNAGVVDKLCCRDGQCDAKRLDCRVMNDICHIDSQVDALLAKRKELTALIDTQVSQKAALYPIPYYDLSRGETVFVGREYQVNPSTKPHTRVGIRLEQGWVEE